MNGNTLMWFGKHKGKKLKDIPFGYFKFLYERNLIKSELLKKYLEENSSYIDFIRKTNELKEE